MISSQPVKHINHLLEITLRRLDKKAVAHKDREARKAGIAEARRILADPNIGEKSERTTVS